MKPIRSIIPRISKPCPIVLGVRWSSTSPNGEKVVYEGKYSQRVRFLKKISLTSSVLSVGLLVSYLALASDSLSNSKLCSRCLFMLNREFFQ